MFLVNKLDLLMNMWNWIGDDV